MKIEDRISDQLINAFTKKSDSEDDSDRDFVLIVDSTAISPGVYLNTNVDKLVGVTSELLKIKKVEVTIKDLLYLIKGVRTGRMQIFAYFYVGSSSKSEILHSANMMIIEKTEKCAKYRIQGITFNSESTNISSAARGGVEVSASHIMFDSIHPVDYLRPLLFFIDYTHNIKSLHRMCQNYLIELPRYFCVSNYFKSRYLDLSVVDTVLQYAKDNFGDFCPHPREDHVRITNTYEKMKQAHSLNLFSSQKPIVSIE